MTNKPMLSVERELLEELQWHYKPYDDHYHKESGYYCPMCGSEKSQGHDAKCEIKAVFDKPAAQHQAEPVAWRYHDESGVSSWFDGAPDQISLDFVAKRGGCIDLSFSKAAEQPAPVAVVMPERMKTEPFTTIDRGSKNYKAGYNAAIAEVAKLNGLKP